MSTTPSGSDAEITHCEWCGAEYAAEGPRPEPPRRAPRAATPPTALPREGAAEPETHCEWCGAEYPVPGEGRA